MSLKLRYWVKANFLKAIKYVWISNGSGDSWATAVNGLWCIMSMCFQGYIM